MATPTGESFTAIFNSPTGMRANPAWALRPELAPPSSVCLRQVVIKSGNLFAVILAEHPRIVSVGGQHVDAMLCSM